MGFKCGIIGLPNVGKSTLFNALTKSKNAQAENFPFCTIDPNIGIVPVPDERLDNLSKISKSKKTINTTISFVDIAGLVKGASKGEGLGNQSRAVWKSTSELTSELGYRVDGLETSRHQANAATEKISRRWRGAPKI